MDSVTAYARGLHDGAVKTQPQRHADEYSPEEAIEHGVRTARALRNGAIASMALLMELFGHGASAAQPASEPQPASVTAAEVDRKAGLRCFTVQQMIAAKDEAALAACARYILRNRLLESR